jgi:hypothetical protein
LDGATAWVHADAYLIGPIGLIGQPARHMAGFGSGYNLLWHSVVYVGLSTFATAVDSVS